MVIFTEKRFFAEFGSYEHFFFKLFVFQEGKIGELNILSYQK